MMEQFIFCGADSPQILMHIAGILKGIGKRVLVLDQSFEHTMLSSLPVLREALPVYEINGVDYTRHLSRGTEWHRDYDIVLTHRGFHDAWEGICENKGPLFLVTDYQRKNIVSALQIARQYPGDIHLLIRDYLSGKINQAYVESLVSIPEDKIKKRYYLSFQQQDYEMELKMQYGLPVRPRTLSSPYKEILLAWCTLICPQMDRKRFQCALKNTGGSI